MRHANIRSIVIVIGLVVGSAIMARAQSETSTEMLKLNPHDSWEGAQLVGASRVSGSKSRIVVVTMDKPDRRQGCRVQSFTVDKIVCSRVFGGSRTYTTQQVLALIIPGDGGARIPLFLGLNAGLGASIWGTVVLAAACPACAVGTGVAALFFFGFAGAVAYSDGQPDRLLYRAPDQELSRKLGYVER
jgi:hypothetical protein